MPHLNVIDVTVDDEVKLVVSLDDMADLLEQSLAEVPPEYLDVMLQSLIAALRNPRE
jgi:predicted Zn-dependent protease with MMP-like domain